MDIGNYYGNWQPSHVGPRAELYATVMICDGPSIEEIFERA